jgi:twitching motility two-component system response regulator PilG
MSTTAAIAVSKMLEDGINSALAGNKLRARQLLMQVVTAEPNNEVSWMWLAGVAETVEQTVHSLQTVLKLNPANDRAKQGLRQTRMKAAQDCLKRQDARAAWQWLSDAARDEPNNEEIWLSMASAGAAISSEAAVKCLQRVLEINPNNDRAKSGLAWYQSLGAGSSAIPQGTQLPMPTDTMPIKSSNTAKIKVERTSTATWACPVCDLTDNQEQPICSGCGSMTTLRPPAAFARHRPSRPDVVSRAIEQLASVPEGVASFETYLRLGIALMNQHRFSDAMAELQSALKLAPDHAELPRYIYGLRIYADADSAREREVRNRSAGQMIMVVDDSATVRKVVVMTLEKAGYRTIQAGDGAEALILLREHGIPALFLVDIMMPGMDGYALCKSLRQNPETSRTPIIMLSGKDGFFNKVRGRMAGASHYITKPFEPSQLLNAIKSQIGSATNV